MGKQKKGKANKKKKGGGGGGGSSKNRNSNTNNTRSRTTASQGDGSSSLGSLSKNSIPKEVDINKDCGNVSLDGTIASSVDQPSTTVATSTSTNTTTATTALDPEATPLRSGAPTATRITELTGDAKFKTTALPLITFKMGNHESTPTEDEEGPTTPDKNENGSTTSSDLPSGLNDVLNELTLEQQELAKQLCSDEAGQRHLFEEWEGTSDLNEKKQMLSELCKMNDSYPNGGLIQYIHNAKDLLTKSKNGINPLEGWYPSIPKGETYKDITSKDALETEALGLKEVGKCGFVLVAGGLGERLGYSGIKINMPTELSTETCYMEYYIQVIQALQKKYAPDGVIKLPLCIMVSNDTHDKTIDLLETNNYFGMSKEQVTIVHQGLGVPALENNDARIAMSDGSKYKIQSKPHGHGDVHKLLYSEGVAKQWISQNIKWICMFQDTNGLAFHTLPLALGVSSKLNLIMNSLAVPRKAGQAIGGITKLTHCETGEERTINVEYNQLDPLLKNSSDFPDGDSNDPNTGYSPFPGNINQLIFQLQPYYDALKKCHGAMPEFVNPKYADEEKTQFKKPTRLECMMQDFPTVLEGESSSKRVGFTCVDNELCFSPVKNATSDGVALQNKGIQPGVAATGEQDQYQSQAIIMRSIGCLVEKSKHSLTFKDIKVQHLTPAIVLKPNFVSSITEYKYKFPSPQDIKISSRSSLVINGSQIVIKSLNLDGALMIEAEDGYTGEAIIENLIVKNKGWVNVSDNSSSLNETIQMRGYRLSKLETTTIKFKADGTIEGDYVPPSQQKDEEEKENEPSAPVTTIQDTVAQVATSVVDSTILVPKKEEKEEEKDQKEEQPKNIAVVKEEQDKDEENNDDDDDDDDDAPVTSSITERSMPSTQENEEEGPADLTTPQVDNDDDNDNDNDNDACQECISGCSIM